MDSVRLEVSAPRFPCWKLARRWGQKDLTARVDDNHRSGWYLRVLQEGYIQAGMDIELVSRPYPDLSIYSLHQIFDSFEDFTDVAETFAACPALKPSLAAYITKKLAALQR